MKHLKLRTVKLALFFTVISLAAFVSACNPINSEKEAESIKIQLDTAICH